MKTPEQEVADILPLEVDPVLARRVLREVPFWFHTFALNYSEGIYTPGVAVDHRYRPPSLPASIGNGVTVVVRVVDSRPTLRIGSRGLDSKGAEITTPFGTLRARNEE